jgi:large repetitive protein
MVMTSVTGTGKGAYTPVAAFSGLPSLAAVQMQVQSNPPAALTLTTGYEDLTGPSQTVTYEVLFSDPFSSETATIYPIVYYPPASLPSSLLSNLPKPDSWATVTPATFAPYYSSTGNQSTAPLGQIDGTPRFMQTTGAASGLFTIAPCTPALSSVTPNSAVALGPATPVTIMGSGFTGGSVVSFTPPGGAPTPIAPSQVRLGQIAATIPAPLLTTAGAAQIVVANDAVTLSNALPFTIKTGQTISFAALTNRPLGSPPFTVSATATSGKTVSFHSQTMPICTVSGTTVTLVTSGTCTVQATQAGDATFAAAPFVNRSFQVTTVPQLVVTRSLSRNSITHEVVVLVTIMNNGSAAASNVQLTVAKIASTVTTTALPQSLGTIATGGAFAQVTVRFPGSVGISGAMTTLRLGGTYTGGSFGTTARITLP